MKSMQSPLDPSSSNGSHGRSPNSKFQKSSDSMKKGEMRLDNYKPQQSMPFKSSNNKFFNAGRDNKSLERIEEEMSGFSSMNNANVSQFDASRSLVF